MINPKKQIIIRIIKQWIARSGFSIEQIVEAMRDQNSLDIDRSSFENKFTTRKEYLYSISVEYVTALLEVLKETSEGRCFNAIEVLLLAYNAELPFSFLQTLKLYFSDVEFDEALREYGLRLSFSRNLELDQTIYTETASLFPSEQVFRLAKQLAVLTNVEEEVWEQASENKLGRFDKITDMAKLIDWFQRLKSQQVSLWSLQLLAMRVLESDWTEWNVWHTTEVLPPLAKLTNQTPDYIINAISKSDVPVDRLRTIVNHLNKLRQENVDHLGITQAFLIFLYNQTFVNMPPRQFYSNIAMMEKPHST